MPANPPDRKGLQWVTVSDFTPGIYSKMRGYGATATPAPVGAAQETGTYRCVCLPNGGLAPGPKRVEDWELPAPELVFSSVRSGYRVIGMYAMGPIRTTNDDAPAFPDEVLVLVEWVSSASAPTPTKKKVVGYRMRCFHDTYSVDTFKAITVSAQTPPSTTVFWGSTMGATRTVALPATSVNASNPGMPVVAFDYWSQGVASEGVVALYPSPEAPTALGTASIVNSASKPSQIALHQNRIILLYNQDWSGPSTTSRRLNDVIFFTDPVNTYTVPSTQVGTALSAEEPTGFGAWGSLSTDAFFLVKARGGGVVVSGALTLPSITPVPGVASCGSNVSQAAATSHGLFYVAADGGVWSWRGSDTSQKVSIQIDDGVFRMFEDQAGVNFHFQEWGDWVLCTNNWMYDTLTGGWWKIENDNPLDDPVAAPLQSGIWAWSRGWRGNHMYGAEVNYNNNYRTPIHTWDRDQSATNYSWQSQPLHESIGKTIDVQELLVMAQGIGTVTVTFTGFDGTESEPCAFTFSETTQPTIFRQPVGVVGGGAFQNQFVTFKIVSDGDTAPAPIVYRVSIGWNERQPVGS